MVMYSVATSGMVVTGPDGEPVLSASIGTMFMAGVIPGLMLATSRRATTYWRARRTTIRAWNAPDGPNAGRRSGNRPGA